MILTSLMKAVIPIEEKCARFAPVTAIVLLPWVLTVSDLNLHPTKSLYVYF